MEADAGCGTYSTAGTDGARRRSEERTATRWRRTALGERRGRGLVAASDP
jgi:hypothetical protein